MDKEKKELEQIRAEISEIHKMLKAIKNDTAYFKEFKENYNIPLFEGKEQQEGIIVPPEMKSEINQKKNGKIAAPQL